MPGEEPGATKAPGLKVDAWAALNPLALKTHPATQRCRA